MINKKLFKITAPGLCQQCGMPRDTRYVLKAEHEGVSAKPSWCAACVCEVLNMCQYQIAIYDNREDLEHWNQHHKQMKGSGQGVNVRTLPEKEGHSE